MYNLYAIFTKYAKNTNICFDIKAPCYRSSAKNSWNLYTLLFKHKCHSFAIVSIVVFNRMRFPGKLTYGDSENHILKQNKKNYH